MPSKSHDAQVGLSHNTARRGAQTHNCGHIHTHTLATRPNQKPAQEDTTRDRRHLAAPFSQETTAPDEAAVHLPTGTRRPRRTASLALKSACRHLRRCTHEHDACRPSRTARARHKAADQRRVALRSPLFLLRTTSPPPECSRKRREAAKRERDPGSSPRQPLPLPKKLATLLCPLASHHLLFLTPAVLVEQKQ